jgi:hypothetical protein
MSAVCAAELRVLNITALLQTLPLSFSVVKPSTCTIFRVNWISLYMFRTVFPSIIKSSRLYIQHQVYVIQAHWLHGSIQPTNRPKHVEWYSINSKNCACTWFYYRNTSQCTVPWTSNLPLSYFNAITLCHTYRASCSVTSLLLTNFCAQHRVYQIIHQFLLPRLSAYINAILRQSV